VKTADDLATYDISNLKLGKRAAVETRRAFAPHGVHGSRLSGSPGYVRNAVGLQSVPWRMDGNDALRTA